MTQTTQFLPRRQHTVATPDGRVLAVEEAGHPNDRVGEVQAWLAAQA